MEISHLCTMISSCLHVPDLNLLNTLQCTNDLELHRTKAAIVYNDTETETPYKQINQHIKSTAMQRLNQISKYHNEDE